MAEIRLVATDLDATLLTSKGTLPAQFAIYAQELATMGVHTVIASGRSLHTLQKMFPRNQEMSFICDNGAVLYTNGQVQYASLIAPATYQQMCRFIRRAGAVPVVCGPTSAYIDRRDIKHRNALAASFAKIEVVSGIEHLTASADKISAFFPEGHSSAALPAFEHTYGDHFAVVIAGEQWVDLMNLGVSKGTALARLGSDMGITAKQMMAFGNTDNDIEMLRLVSYSYIVENATFGMEKVARFRTASCDEGGVLMVMQQLVTSKRRTYSRPLTWASGR